MTFQFTDDAILIAFVITFGFLGVTLALESAFGLATAVYQVTPLVLVVTLFYAYAEQKWTRYKADGDEPSEGSEQRPATDGGREQ